MPEPRPDEEKDEFIERCVPIVIDEGTAKDGKQAYAICLSMWEKAQEERAEDSPRTRAAGGFIRAYREDTADGTLSFVASTAGVKRDGLDLDPERWMLDNYRQNPVVLWAHQYDRPPIGRADVEVRDGALRARIEFDPDDEFAQLVRGKYERGYLNAVSVGWGVVRDKEHGEFYDLLDVSAVPVPADASALIERQRAAYTTLRDALDATLQRSEEAEDWQSVAAEMVSLYLRSAEDADDEERERRYRALLPKYRRLGKEPPEFLTMADLEPLTADLRAGLFVSGEPDVVPEPFARMRLEERLDQLTAELAALREQLANLQAPVADKSQSDDELWAELAAALTTNKENENDGS